MRVTGLDQRIKQDQFKKGGREKKMTTKISEDLEKLKEVSPKYHEILSNLESLLMKNVSITKDLKEKLEKSTKQKDGDEEDEDDILPQILEVNKNLNTILNTFRDINNDTEKK
eukprot:g4008.t1